MPAGAAPPLLQLPVELQVAVFASLARLRDAVALAKSSRALHATWRDHKPRVIDTIQSRTTICYADAVSLAHAQLAALAHAPPGSAPPGGRAARFLHPGVSHAQFLVAENARDVAAAAAYFLDKIVGADLAGAGGSSSPLHAHGAAAVRPHRDPPFLTASERARFAHAYYRVWELVTLDAPARAAALAAVGLAEHWLLCEICFMLLVHVDAGLLPRPGAATAARGIHEHLPLADIFDKYKVKLQDAGHSGMIAAHAGCPKDFYMAIFDDHQERFRQNISDIYAGRRTDD